MYVTRWMVQELQREIKYQLHRIQTLLKTKNTEGLHRSCARFLLLLKILTTLEENGAVFLKRERHDEDVEPNWEEVTLESSEVSAECQSKIHCCQDSDR